VAGEHFLLRDSGCTVISRRRLLTGFVLAWAPLGAAAQEYKAGKVYRIGFLRNGPPPETFIEGLRTGLRELGYVEGQNISIEYGLARSADDLPSAAARLASLARPGGNITGLAGIHSDLMGKRLELLREAVHKLSRVAVISHATNPGNAEYIRQAELAARALGAQLVILAVRDAGDFERVFSEARGASALIQLDDVIFTSHRKRVVELAVRHQLAAMYGFKEFVHAGGLMAYGPDYPDLYRRAATYVDKILKGANPADLPIEQPTKFELVVNLKTAKALGLTIPQSLLQRADQVIE
jgi:putative ABC transport system substrate-binding protein